MKKILITLFLVSLSTEVFASIKSNIIRNIKDTKNFSFNFEQNINGKIENGTCTIEYPKKIFCDYSSNNNKILVSNGKSLVIKTNASYYLYPLEKTPLNLILDKSFLVKKIIKSNERIIDEKFINFTFNEQEDMVRRQNLDQVSDRPVGFDTENAEASQPAASGNAIVDSNVAGKFPSKDVNV